MYIYIYVYKSYICIHMLWAIQLNPVQFGLVHARATQVNTRASAQAPVRDTAEVARASRACMRKALRKALRNARGLRRLR